MATKLLDPLSINYTEHLGGGKLDVSQRKITINSVSFWRDDSGTLFLRGWDEDHMTTVDLVAANVRF